jgi:hypothetical protein
VAPESAYVSPPFRRLDSFGHTGNLCETGRSKPVRKQKLDIVQDRFLRGDNALIEAEDIVTDRRRIYRIDVLHKDRTS